MGLCSHHRIVEVCGEVGADGVDGCCGIDGRLGVCDLFCGRVGEEGALIADVEDDAVLFWVAS